MSSLFPIALALLLTLASAPVAATAQTGGNRGISRAAASKDTAGESTAGDSADAAKADYRRLLGQDPYLRDHSWENWVVTVSRYHPDRRPIDNGLLMQLLRGESRKSAPSSHLRINMDGTAQRYNMDPADDGGVRGVGRSHLSAVQMAALRKLLRAMPPAGKAPASIENLLVVNYLSGKKYAIRLYDTRKLPPVVKKIEQTWGEETPRPRRPHPKSK